MKRDDRDPRKIRRDLVDIGKMLRQLYEDYTWAYGFVYGLPSSSVANVGGGHGHGDPVGERAADATNDHRHDVESPDTERSGGSKTEARRVLENVSHEINEALRQLRRAQRLLRKRFDADVRDFMFLPDPGQIYQPSQVQEARSAQQRRQGRGEDRGNG